MYNRLISVRRLKRNFLASTLISLVYDFKTKCFPPVFGVNENDIWESLHVDTDARFRLLSVFLIAVIQYQVRRNLKSQLETTPNEHYRLKINFISDEVSSSVHFL